MIIPKSIEIGPVRYDVRLATWYASPHVGFIDYKLQTITLNSIQGFRRPAKPRTLAHLFWHEVTHGILHDMKRPDLRDDEKFVDAFAKRLNQVVWSAKL